MSFDDAMASHIMWKLRLMKYIDGPDGAEFDRTTVGRTESCDLGKWMRDEGLKYRAVPAYERLLQQHADFHARAAEVVSKVEGGDAAGARAVVSGPFEAASRGVINAIAELRNHVNER